jgi:uncharacterized protein (TIGR03086 family)
MDALQRVDEAAQAALGAVQGIKPDQLENQTPCSGWNVQALMNHMISTMRFFEARATGAERSSEPAGTASSEDAAGQLAAWIRATAAAWHEPGALERKIQAPWGEAPAEFLATMTASEMLMHGWDLARATGQAYGPKPELVEEVLAGISITLTPERRGTSFGPERAAPKDAPAIDRLAAFMGRQL